MYAATPPCGDGAGVSATAARARPCSEKDAGGVAAGIRGGGGGGGCRGGCRGRLPLHCLLARERQQSAAPLGGRSLLQRDKALKNLLLLRHNLTQHCKHAGVVAPGEGVGTGHSCDPVTSKLAARQRLRARARAKRGLGAAPIAAATPRRSHGGSRGRLVRQRKVKTERGLVFLRRNVP